MHPDLGLLEEALAISRAMKTAAELGDWPALQRMQDQRESLIRQFFADGPVASAEDTAPLLAALSQVNQEVVAVTQSAKQHMGRLLSEIAQGRKAIDKYQQHTE